MCGESSQTQNSNSRKGEIRDGKRAWEILPTTRYRAPPTISSWSSAYNNGGVVRLQDVATVTDSRRPSVSAGFLNGNLRDIVIFRQPGANIIETVDACTADPVLPATISRGRTG